MTIGSYEIVRIQTKKILQSPTSKTWYLEMWLSDNEKQSLQTENLSIVTQVSEPIPNHPRGLELKALLHVRALLDAQIEALQSG